MAVKNNSKPCLKRGIVVYLERLSTMSWKRKKIIFFRQHVITFAISLIIFALNGIDTHAEFFGLIESNIGYDTNATNSYEEKSSAFCQYRLKFDYLFEPDLPLYFDLYAEGNYQQYFELKDNYLLKAGGLLTFNKLDKTGRWSAGIFSDVSAYRDGLTESDEREGFTVGGQLNCLASARVTLGLSQYWRWFDYSNPIIDFVPAQDQIQTGQNQMPNNPPIIQPMPPVMVKRKIERDDTIWSSRISGLIYLNSQFKTDMAFEYDDCNSSIDSESYNEIRAELYFIWNPKEQWEVSPFFSLGRYDFDELPNDQKRNDIETRAGLNISHFIKEFELYFKLELTDNNSDIQTETYQKTVTQLGVSWSF